MKKFFILLLISAFVLSLSAKTKADTIQQITTDDVSYTRDLNCPTGTVFSLSANGYSSGANSDIDGGYRCNQYFDLMSAPIATIHWWGIRAYFDGAAWGACTEDPIEYEITLWDDNAGLPGTPLMTYSNQVISGVGTGEMFASVYEIMEYTFNLPAPYSLLNGWVSIQAKPGNVATCWFLWLSSGDAGTFAQQWDESASAYIASPGYPLTLCLIGTPAIADDVGVIGVTAPVTGTLTGTETVTIEIMNFGSASQSNIPVSFEFNAVTYNQTYPGPLSPLGTDTYTFTTVIDCSVPGPYSLDAWTALPGDEDPSNDLYTHNFESLAAPDCTWEIWLYDVYGDGWNGGSIDVLANGVVKLDDITVATGYGPDVFAFDIYDGGTVSTLFTASGWPEENWYEIYDNEGNLIITSGPVAGGPPDVLVDPAVCAIPAACPAPTDLATTNVTVASADLGWTAGAAETLWDVRWGLTGFDPNAFPPGGTLVGGLMATNHSLAGLAPYEVYDWYVRADCGTRDVSVWVGPMTFTAFDQNDDCASAEAVGEVISYPLDSSAAWFTASGVGTCLTSPDLWFVYTATADGTIDVDLCGSSFDTILAVYDGDCANLNELGCNDDSCGLQSALFGIPVVNGGAYYIQAGGYSSNVGAGLLTVAFTAPPVVPANVIVSVDTILGEVTISWDFVTGQVYFVYSDFDPYGAFGTQVASDVAGGSVTLPLPSVDTFYHVTADHAVIRETNSQNDKKSLINIQK